MPTSITRARATAVAPSRYAAIPISPTAISTIATTIITATMRPSEIRNSSKARRARTPRVYECCVMCCARRSLTKKINLEPRAGARRSDADDDHDDFFPQEFEKNERSNKETNKNRACDKFLNGLLLDAAPRDRLVIVHTYTILVLTVIVFVLCVRSMHRHERPAVGAVQQAAPLPQPARPLHQLHLRRRQSRDHLAPEPRVRSQLSPAHTRGHRLRAHLARRRAPRRAAPPADHSRPHPLPRGDPEAGVRPHSHEQPDVQSGDAGAARHTERQRGGDTELQSLPHQDHQLGRDHHGVRPQVQLQVQLHDARAVLQRVRQELRAGLLGRRPRELPALLQDQLLAPVLAGALLRPESARVLPSVLRRRLRGPQTVRLSGLQELLRRRRLHPGVPAHAEVQPDHLLVGGEPGRQVRLRRHLREEVPGASAQGQRRLRAILSAQEEGAERRVRAVRGLLPQDLPGRPDRALGQHRQLQGLHDNRGLDQHIRSHVQGLPADILQQRLVRLALRAHAPGPPRGLQHVEGDHGLSQYPGRRQEFQKSLVLQEFGGDRGPSADRVLLQSVHSEDVAGVAAAELAEEDQFGLGGDTREQGSVLRQHHQLGQDQKVAGAREPAGQQQEPDRV
ncbi:unnamed protein product, partial [Trichogramma brassicae]